MLELTLIFLTLVHFGHSQNCFTASDSKDPNAPCVFPFKYDGVTYFGCPVDLFDKNRRWCSTQVDQNGEHVRKRNKFGFCRPNCPKHQENSGNSCPQNGQTCQSILACQGQFTTIQSLFEQKCTLSDGSSGLCCSKIFAVEGSSILEKGFFGLRNEDFSFFDENLTSKAARFGDSFTKAVDRVPLNTIGNRKSNFGQHSLNQRQSPGVAELAHKARALAATAEDISKEGNIRSGGGTTFQNVDLSNTILDEDCYPRIKCKSSDPFRSIDGSCNNLKNPLLGKSFTPLQRVLDPDFEDGFLLPRVSKNGQNLPSTRDISTETRFNNQNLDPSFTALLVAFGQFLDHDLDHVPISQTEEGEPVECCEDGEFLAFNQKTKEEKMLCFPIEVSRRDSLNTRCINFVRSVTAPNLDCKPGPLEQVNQITHWLDSSNVYGSLNDVARAVRSFKDGKLSSIRGIDGQEQLPIDPTTTCTGPTGQCALAGDLRPNEQPTLGAIHVLFLREHNRVAEELKKLNPGLQRDEEIYQQARRIVNAQWQHIIYNEWLPLIVGGKFAKNNGLLPLSEGFSTAYRDDVDPRVTNEFAAAAFRVGHTLIPDVIRTFSTITKAAKRVIDLQDVFSDGDVLREPNLTDELIKGLTIQQSEGFDNNFVKDVTENLFDDNEFGLDLIAINMQRGRDHGLPGYVFYREICGVGKVNDFEDLASNISPSQIQNLKRAYKKVEDIDLFIGMISEEVTVQDALVGDTFLCLISDVFGRVRVGDRFFYDNVDQVGSFTSTQLAEIRKASIARLICDNTRIEEIQPLAFRLANEQTNPLTKCENRQFLSQIPKVDLSVF